MLPLVIGLRELVICRTDGTSADVVRVWSGGVRRWRSNEPHGRSATESRLRWTIDTTDVFRDVYRRGK